MKASNILNIYFSIYIYIYIYIYMLKASDILPQEIVAAQCMKDATSVVNTFEPAFIETNYPAKC